MTTVVTDPAIRLVGLTRGVDRQRIDDIWPEWTSSRPMGGGAIPSPGRKQEREPWSKL